MSGAAPFSITMASSLTTIKNGTEQYGIELIKIPYLSSFIDYQLKAQPQSTEWVHDPIPLFDVALKGIQSGYRQCFRSLPPELPQFQVLCETYDFLCVDVVSHQSIDEIITDLKSCRSDYEREYKRYREVKGDKSRARDTAFKLLYLMLLGDFKNDKTDSVKVYNAVLFIVSHSSTFKWRTRKVIRAAYEARFILSSKQKAQLDKWEKSDAAKLALEDQRDVTTEQEVSDLEIDSDWSD